MTEDRDRLRRLFSGPADNVSDRWSQLWDAGDFLPFDRGVPNPALVDILKDRHDLIGDCFMQTERDGRVRKKALVPGCGRGYDVLLLASFGYDAYGLEISETAVKRCKEEQEKNGHKFSIQDNAKGGGSINFIHGDFFVSKPIQLGDASELKSFELIYDYTVWRAGVKEVPGKKKRRRIHANCVLSVLVRLASKHAPCMVAPHG